MEMDDVKVQADDTGPQGLKDGSWHLSQLTVTSGLIVHHSGTPRQPQAELKEITLPT